MKTTIDINGQLLEEARKRAFRDKTTVKSLVEEGLRHLLAERQERPAYRLRKATFKGRGLCKELDGAGWEKIRDRAYEGHGA